MELFIENLQNNINVDNNNLNFITNHNKNQIELTDEESVHVKKGSGNYNCQYNCYFVIEFDNTTAWVWSKDIDLKVTIGSSDGSIKTLKLVDSIEQTDSNQRNVICLTDETYKPVLNKEIIEIRGLKYNTKLMFFLKKDDTISYEFNVTNLNTIDYKTYYQINYLDLLKELMTNNNDKNELLKLREKLLTQDKHIKKNNELIKTYKTAENINNSLINELKTKNNLLSEKLDKLKFNYDQTVEENKNLRQNNNLLQFDIADLEYENDKLISDLNEQKKNIKDNKNNNLERELSKNTIKKLYNENTKLHNNIISLESKNKILKKTNYNLNQKDKKIQKNLQSSKIKLNQYIKECSETKSRFDLLKLNIKTQFDQEKRKNPDYKKNLNKIYKNINKKFIL